MPRRILPALALALPLSTALAAEAPPQQFADLGDLRLESGAVIKDCKLGYRTLGTLNAARSNAVVFLPWHTGKSVEALGLLGAKGLFNTAGHYVIVIDAIGSGAPRRRRCWPTRNTPTATTSKTPGCCSTTRFFR
jgi:homoserine O-acetyltransferase